MKASTSLLLWPGLLASLSLLTGCDPYTWDGKGTETLLVRADVVYDSNSNTLEAIATVERDGDPVDHASVTLTDVDDEVLVLEPAPGGEGGRYRGSAPEHRRRLALSVQEGLDSLTARLEGPGVHTIISPKPGEELTAESEGFTFAVHWSVEDGVTADTVRIIIDGGEPYEVGADDGGFDELSTHELWEGEHELCLERENRLELAGGVGGSLMTSTYRTCQDFVWVE